MKVNQIYSLLNDINKEMWGETALKVNNLAGIISMGETIVGDGTDTDKFLGALVDRIGKTVIRTLDLELDFPALYMDSFEFGAILQKINVNPFDSIASSEWKVGDIDPAFTPTFADIHKPSVTVRYFKGVDTWKFQVTIPDDLFSTAFTSETAMSNFIDAIIQAMTDSMTISINNMSRTAVSNLIAEKIHAGHNVINLVDLYNTAYGLTGNDAIDAAGALVSKEFYRFASTIIRKYIKYLNQPSVLYNEAGLVRATARDNMHVLMLTDFAAGFDAYLLSDSFRDVFGMPLYTEVAYWQGNHDTVNGDNSFAANSSIHVIPSSQEGEDNPDQIDQTGIVCVLADRQSVAVGLNKRRTGTWYNSIDAYTNLSSTASLQYINDISENCVVFCIADSIDTPSVTLDKSTLTFASSAADPAALTATTNPAGATVTWKSSKNAVATVSNGTVTPAGAGTCTITATIEVGGQKASATCAVTVSA